MILLHIHLTDADEAKTMVAELLHEKLIAAASISVNRSVYYQEDDSGQINQEARIIIHAQTKSLLFKPIQIFLEEKGHKNVIMFSTPLTQATPIFDQFLREHTKPI